MPGSLRPKLPGRAGAGTERASAESGSPGAALDGRCRAARPRSNVRIRDPVVWRAVMRCCLPRWRLCQPPTPTCRREAPCVLGGRRKARRARCSGAACVQHAGWRQPDMDARHATHRSSSRVWSSMLNLYWKPLQPPPSTSSLRKSLGLCLASCSSLSLCTQTRYAQGPALGRGHSRACRK